MTTPRIPSLDIIRTLACLMVILLHSVNALTDQLPYIGRVVSMLTEPGVGLFFMVSGALLLPVKMSYKDFLSRRLSKVLLPTLFFTFFYIAVKLIYNELTFQELPVTLLSIPFSPQGDNILWFMYAIIGMYLLAPIISPFLEKASKRELQFVLFLWVITLLLPLLQLFLEVKTGKTSMLHPFSGFTGYFILGYYLVKYPVRLPLWTFPICLTIPILACYWCVVTPTPVPFLNTLWFLSIFCLMQCLAWFQLIHSHNWNPQSQFIKAATSFSQHSFLVYLIHMFVLKRISLPLISSTFPQLSLHFSSTFPQVSQFLHLLSIFLLTTILSYLLSVLLSLLPKLFNRPVL